VLTEVGPVDIDVLRDREGSLELWRALDCPSSRHPVWSVTETDELDGTFTVPEYAAIPSSPMTAFDGKATTR
jgi:hypothetical protein